VTNRTELLRVNEAFKESFVDGETAGTTDPTAQETYETTDITSTPATEGADHKSEVEATEAESDSATDDGTGTEPDAQLEDEQYPLDGLGNALPDDSEPTDSNDKSPVSEDNTQSGTAETDSETDPPADESVDPEAENSETGNLNPEDYW